MGRLRMPSHREGGGGPRGGGGRRKSQAGEETKVGVERTHGRGDLATQREEEIIQTKPKGERKEVEIRGTNMALLVAVADTSADDSTPHLEHLSVMP